MLKNLDAALVFVTVECCKYHMMFTNSSRTLREQKLGAGEEKGGGRRRSEGQIVVSSLVQQEKRGRGGGGGSVDVVQGTQQFLPLQQVLAALQGGVDLAVVAGELRQAEEGGGALRGAAQKTTGQV